MSKKAWIYVATVFFFGILIAWREFLLIHYSFETWLFFIVLTCLATLAQLFKSEAPTHQLYHPALVFLFAGVLSIPFALFIMMVIISHLAEWGKERLMKSPHLRDWYIQPFNICMHICTGFIAGQVIKFIHPGYDVGVSLQAILAAFIGAVAYVLVQSCDYWSSPRSGKRGFVERVGDF